MYTQKHSLLEHHHIQSARGIINESRLLDHLGVEEKEGILQLMDDLVLGTDFTQHKHYVGLFEGKLNEGVDIRNTSEDRKFVLMVSASLWLWVCVCAPWPWGNVCAYVCCSL